MRKAKLIFAGLLVQGIVACAAVRPKFAIDDSTRRSNQAQPHNTSHGVYSPQRNRLWDQVDPGLRRKVEAIQMVTAPEGYDLRPLEAYRSPERQAALLASSSGVTSVGAWKSCHNYGLAVDVALFVCGEPSWDTNDPYVLAGYQRFGELAEDLGLNWGGRCTRPVDYPHVEM